LYELHAQYHQKSYAVCLIHIVCIFALAIDVFSQSDVGGNFVGHTITTFADCFA